MASATETYDGVKPRAATTPLVVLVAVAFFINYVDRGNVATASPLIQDELRLSNTQVGLLASAFFWAYAPMQLPIGWLIQRLGAYWLLASSVALWSIATALTGVTHGFTMLMALRILLGIGESAAFPCVSKLLADNLPPEKLGAANGFAGAGVALGPAFGTLVGGLIMARFGWRASFLIFGLGSLLWLLPWLTLARGARLREKADGFKSAPEYLEILGRRPIWGTMLGHFSANYNIYFVMSWLPLYLVKAHGFTLVEMAKLGAVVYLFYAASCAVSGWASDLWIATGASLTRVRKTIIVSGHCGAAICFLVSSASNHEIAIVGLLSAGVCFGLIHSGVFAISQTVAGPNAAGKWVALQNGVANMAGILAPVITGAIVDRTGGFFGAFVVASAISLLGIVGWGIIVQRVAPLSWPDTARRNEVTP